MAVILLFGLKKEKEKAVRAVAQKLGVNVTEVARKAQVSRSTFYAHFNNLDEVRERVVRDYFESLSSLRAQFLK